MALYGGQRDISLFRKINREMIHRYIDTEVLYYKLNLIATNTNIYDETDSKVYSTSQLIPSIVTVDDTVWNTEDFGAESTQTATFGFLRDDLSDYNIFPEIGDVIEYRSRFFEIDDLNENQLVAGKDPENWFGGASHGYSVSIICSAHMTRQSRLNIVETNFGNSVSIKDQQLPNNL